MTTHITYKPIRSWWQQPMARLIAGLVVLASVVTTLVLVGLDLMWARYEPKCIPAGNGSNCWRRIDEPDLLTEIWMPAISFTLFGLAVFFLLVGIIGGIVLWAKREKVNVDTVGGITAAIVGCVALGVITSMIDGTFFK